MSRWKRHRQRLYQAVLPASLSRLIPGNQVTLLQNGEAYFPALEAAFDQAQHDIYLQTYIYEQDATGGRIADALKRAVLRGVNAYLLIDGYGSKDLPPSLLDRLRADGVKVLIFRPKISPWTFRRERLRRMHRKIAVVDREIAFVGGINIINDSEETGDIPPRFDYAVAVQGPLVDVIRLSAQRMWSMTAWSYFRKGTVLDKALPASATAGGHMSAALLVRDNFHHRRDIEKAYMRAIEGAKSEIILAHAYFLPGFDFRHALVNAARRGVRVVLLLQGRVEYYLQYYASRALYGNFLDAGIEIYEYRKSFLHAKVAVIDGHWATVGSSNIDPFSLLLSREANVAIDDEEFGATMTHSLKRAMETDGLRILRDKWKEQPARLRFMSWLSYGFLRLMTGISGYAREKSRGGKKRTSGQVE
jgi:cardiolipin synthase A/B